MNLIRYINKMLSFPSSAVTINYRLYIYAYLYIPTIAISTIFRLTIGKIDRWYVLPARSFRFKSVPSGSSTGRIAQIHL